MLLVKRISIKTLAFTIFFLSIVGYTYYQVHDVITGPVVKITKPQNGATLTDPVIELLGTAKNISEIELDGRHIFVTEAGVFREKLLLSPGYNIITIRAKDRFGRKTEKTLGLVY